MVKRALLLVKIFRIMKSRNLNEVAEKMIREKFQMLTKFYDSAMNIEMKEKDEKLTERL